MSVTHCLCRDQCRAHASLHCLLDDGDRRLCGVTLLNTAQMLAECDARHDCLAARGDLTIIRDHKDAARMNTADACRLASKAAANSFE
eukprot:2415416-Rhodomonas_salina.1